MRQRRILSVKGGVMGGSEQQLRRGTLELILLSLLEQRAKYGYELVSEMEQRSGGVFRIKEGTLYPVLYRLEDQGCIEAEWSRPERGVPRKYYGLTEAGTDRLEELRAEWSEFAGAVNGLVAGSTAEEGS
jgi:PadR family transcriptional regulator PadR